MGTCRKTAINGHFSHSGENSLAKIHEMVGLNLGPPKNYLPCIDDSESAGLHAVYTPVGDAFFVAYRN